MKRLSFLGVILVATTRVWSADFGIVSFTAGGDLSWSDPNTNGYYSVQWAPSLQETNWYSDWRGLTQLAATGGTISVKVPMFFRVVYRPRATNELILVAGGGQPQGPTYDFYMSKYEVRNEEFAQFLNDAQANTGTPRGANMFFADNGKVYFNAAMSSDQTLFDISKSRLLYNKNNSVGNRYSVHPDFVGHPVVGVSWYGCAKYCNWFTVFTARGDAQRCYSEGTTAAAWKPANLSSTQWNDGFDYAERLDWVQNYTGFRLPMDDNTDLANDFNEWYKAAAWTGTSNVLYGFGRNTIMGRDANYSGSGDPYETFTPGTTPVGYYDGSLQGGNYQTASNQNFYGIFDLTGNADEWSNDNAVGFVPHCRGGGWSGGLVPNNTTHGNLQRYGTDNITGFRVVTTTP